jgi:hypothetical protein
MIVPQLLVTLEQALGTETCNADANLSQLAAEYGPDMLANAALAWESNADIQLFPRASPQVPLSTGLCLLFAELRELLKSSGSERFEFVDSELEGLPLDISAITRSENNRLAEIPSNMSAHAP